MEVKLKSGDGVRLVELRNPWGNQHEWSGAWADAAPEWKAHPEVAKELKFQPRADGLFWMSWESFVEIFTSVEVCRKSMPTVRASFDDESEGASRHSIQPGNEYAKAAAKAAKGGGGGGKEVSGPKGFGAVDRQKPKPAEPKVILPKPGFVMRSESRRTCPRSVLLLGATRQRATVALAYNLCRLRRVRWAPRRPCGGGSQHVVQGSILPSPPRSLRVLQIRSSRSSPRRRNPTPRTRSTSWHIRGTSRRAWPEEQEASEARPPRGSDWTQRVSRRHGRRIASAAESAMLSLFEDVRCCAWLAVGGTRQQVPQARGTRRSLQLAAATHVVARPHATHITSTRHQ